MKQHVVENAAKRVLRVVALRRVLDRFRDGDTEAARGIGCFGEYLAGEIELQS